MRVVYVAEFDGNINSGVSKKLIAIHKAFCKNGIESQLIFLYRTNDIACSIPGVEFMKFPSPPYSSKFDKIKSYLTTHSYFGHLKSYLKKGDVVIFRNLFPSFYFYRFVRNCGCSVYVETVSNYYSEALMRKAYVYYGLLKLFTPIIRNALAGIIGVTEEIIEINFGKKALTRPFFIIGNGIDADSLLPVSRARFTDTYNLICVANLCKWHGLSRLIEGIKKYKGPNNIKFHIVGNGPDRPSLEALVRELELEDQVIFHGFLSGPPLNSLFDQCHIGVANLGTHLKKISQTSPLKSREYCARGIPFIYTAHDKDFTDFPYALRLPSGDHPIDVDLITSFYESISAANYVPEMRTYAIQNLTWESRVGKLVPFLGQR